jgi:D-glycero-alpha-D-manno-heptose-7-phosphate kinase
VIKCALAKNSLFSHGKQSSGHRHLRKFKIESKAPTRVDCGGGVDHRLISALCHKEKLQTFNIAIQLYSKICLSSYKKGFILINAGEVGKEELELKNISLNGKFALVCAIISFFGISGLEVKIETDYPLVSGLGGSGSLSIALMGALIKLLKLAGQEITFTPKQIIWLAHTIEDGLYHNTGLQDQACAYYGGVNLWRWQYPNHQILFSRKPLRIKSEEIEKHTCLIYSGVPHYPSNKGSKFVKSFINNRLGFSIVQKINRNVESFVVSLAKRDWASATKALNEEEYLRRKFLSFELGKNTIQLIREARQLGCGIKFAGGGGGGCLWAIGQVASILRFKKICQSYAQPLPFKVARRGLVVKTDKNDFP